ncbi:hypothetical protein FHU38_002990 [Saccharomonospora amisosensis]|uniref:Uncharacterized protein n=1 Tax=Saccharomonospora amisosensis TaxID=1128677 RepID=A0A7X5UR55_9PSEU|nr:hypothetical protein [Saccharomonospora amisosensis]
MSTSKVERGCWINLLATPRVAAVQPPDEDRSRPTEKSVENNENPLSTSAR